MGKAFGGQILGRVLKEEQVRYLFCIQGGHNYSIISIKRRSLRKAGD